MYNPENQSRKVTEKQLDDYVKTRNCSYGDAYEHFGVTPSEVVLENSQTDTDKFPSVNLGERAIHLSNALDSYLRASKLDGFNRASGYKEHIQNRYDIEDIDNISGSEKRFTKTGDKEFFKAFGGRALIDAGYGAEFVHNELEGNIKQFVAEHTGPYPDNRKNRAKLRKVLKNQIK